MKQKKNIALLITVASLGYFVDIYDLILFNIIKKDSLSSLNIDVNTYETVLFRWQMAGMLIGGLIWGILGDVKGRVSVLFGSILLYSVANVANAFVTTVEAYKFWRLLAGIGLAGELGAAITLVSELMPKEKRGIGTMIIVTFGALGAVFAFFVAKNGEGITTIVSQIMGRELENWQTAYIVGGVLGLLLLLMRAGTFESALFENATTTNVKRGNFFMLFRKAHFRKYLACIVIGLPVWFVVGILIALSHK
ncbi:MAG: MFS transporter, partial [Bacteroidota bacterium]